MTSYLYQRREDSLVPSEEGSLAALRSIPNESEMLVTLGLTQRNIKQWKLFFHLCRIASDNLEVYNGNIDACREELLIACKYADYYVNHDGRIRIRAKSMKGMAQDKFDALFQTAVNKICEWLGNSPKEVMDQVNAALADKRYEGYRR